MMRPAVALPLVLLLAASFGGGVLLSESRHQQCLRVCPSDYDGICRHDDDCEVGAVCACLLPGCSVVPAWSYSEGSPNGRCFSLDKRLSAKLPIRVDGGWLIEAMPDAGRIERLSDAWRISTGLE